MITLVTRFGKGSMYHKKAIYKFKTKKTKKTAVPVKPVFVEKKVLTLTATIFVLQFQ